MEVPWLNSIEINISNDIKIYLLRSNLLLKVITNKLLVSRVESKTGRNT